MYSFMGPGAILTAFVIWFYGPGNHFDSGFMRIYGFTTQFDNCFRRVSGMGNHPRLNEMRPDIYNTAVCSCIL